MEETTIYRIRWAFVFIIVFVVCTNLWFHYSNMSKVAVEMELTEQRVIELVAEETNITNQFLASIDMSDLPNMKALSVKMQEAEGRWQLAERDLDRIAATNAYHAVIKEIFDEMESHPSLFGLQSYRRFRADLMDVHNELYYMVRHYNERARIHNAHVEVFPNSILAKLYGFRKVTYLASPMDPAEPVPGHRS